MTKKIIFSIFTFIFAIVPFFCFSKEQPKKWKHAYTHRHFDVRDGLIQRQVFTSFQDSYGYLWFSTFGGISRFDGINFTNYNQSDLQIISSINCIGQYESAVYLLHQQKIVFIYPDGTMEHYPIPDSYNYRYFARKTTIKDNYLYLFNCRHETQTNDTNLALFRFDLKNKIFEKILDNLPPLDVITSNGKIYAISRSTPQKQQLTLYRFENKELHAVHTLSSKQYEFPLGFIQTNQNEWFAFNKKEELQNEKHNLYRCFIENDTLRLEFLFKFSEWIVCIEKQDEHRYIIGTHHSAFVFDDKEKTLTPFPVDLCHVNNISFDRDRNLWFSTEDGVFQFSRYFFESFYLGLGRFDQIWSVIKDGRKNVWFSSYTYGIWRADTQGNLYPVSVTKNNKKISPVLGYFGSCSDGSGRVFLPFHLGVAFSQNQNKQLKINKLDAILTGVSLGTYYDSKNEAVWFGGRNEDDLRTLNVLHSNGQIKTYPFGNRFIISICRDGNQKLRMGTFYGEAWLDEENQVVVHDTVSRPYKGIFAMASDDKGTLWKGCTEGLFAEDKQGNIKKITGCPIGFVLNYNNKYIIYGDDNLQILSLSDFYSGENVNIRIFDYYDGQDLLGCVQNGATIDSEGYVWITGGEKVIRFHPEQLMKIPPLQPQTPYIAAVYNATINSDWRLLQTHELLQLKNKENFLRFDILLAEPSAPDKLVFRYKLNGYNELWTTTKERSFVFQNLPSGKYRLEVQSSINEQQWSESVFSPFIKIKSPFLLRFPGFLLILLGVAGVTGFIIYYTRKIIMKKEEEKRSIDQLRHRAIRAKFIPHFTGNVLNTINYLISKNPDAAQKYISDFAGFSYQTLLNSDTLCRTLQEELDYTELYLKLEKLRFEEKLEYEICVGSEIDTQELVPTMLLQTFCENALKHGLRPKPEGGKITVRVAKQDDYTVFSVEDNGIGREKAQKLKTDGTKEGLKIVQQQLALLNKNKTQKIYMQIIDLHDKNGEPSGTRFEVWIP